MSTPVKPAKRNGAKHPASDHSTADHSVADDGKFFGKPIPREEDTRLLSGQGRYLDDLGHNALIAAFVRSPHAHARIIDIDIDQALEVPGVHAIYTYEDLLADTPEMAENLPLLIPHPGIIAPRNGYPLAKDEVKHVGEAIAMVVADNRYIAEDACAKIDVTYEALKPVVGIDVARTAANAVHADVPDNVAAHLQHGSEIWMPNWPPRRTD